MTTDKNQFYNALPYRIAIAGLIQVIDRLCDENCKVASKIPEYNQAKELLSAPEEANT